jgi:uncharacterized protein YfeS
MNGTNQQGFGYRARRTFVRLLTVLVILGLGGAVAFLLAQLNARTFTLAVENGNLMVLKGRNLPVGSVPYRPSDPKLTDAYAPIPLEGADVASLVEQRFSEREELDRALFPLLETLARPRINADEPKRVEQGVYYLRRAQQLTGLTEEQRLRLQQMQADVAFYQARQKLEDARKQVAEALTQLQLAADAHNKNARNAHQMLTTVGPVARQLEEALRAAVHSQSAPPAPPTGTQAPAPTQPPSSEPQPQPEQPQPEQQPQPGAAETTPEAQTPAQQPATGVNAGPQAEPEARPTQPTP